ncbi:hypothetical protein ABW19_dt0206812 [Dactylella cylindrospora]|nr:hypothetical protein ABW19_dt0206812 [Dactylella cylindrospora]
MRQCLTGAEGGYYTSSPDPFGEKGDFVTSPEISQLFGEMIGIWVVAEWLAQGKCRGKKISLIELGPGKGTLMDDILRTIRRFPIAEQIGSVRLVEASPALRDMQCFKLCGEDSKPEWKVGTWEGKTKYIDAPINWYEDVRQIPMDIKPPPSNLILTTSEARSREPEFCFTVAPKQSSYARLLGSLSPRYAALSEVSDAVVEISPDSHAYIRYFCESINTSHNGAALVVDYGPADTVPINSLRGIQKHTRVSPFIQPGLVDISADVDFGALVETALKGDFKIEVHGPAEQGQFLLSLGMKERYDALSATTTNLEKLAVLKSGFERLTESGGLGMGKIYKALAIVPEAGGRPVAGFPQVDVLPEDPQPVAE